MTSQRTNTYTSLYPKYTTPTIAAHSSAKLLAATITAPLCELDDGAGPLLVVVVPEPVVVTAALDEELVELRVALLMVVLRCRAVPVAAEPEAPAPVPTAPVPTAPPVPIILVAVALALTTWVVVTLALELLDEPNPKPPATTLPNDGLVVTEDEADEVAEATAPLLTAAEPPVRVIMPV